MYQRLPEEPPISWRLQLSMPVSRDFRTLAAESGWNNAALYDVILKGLSADIQDLLVPLDLPTSLDALIALAIRTDNRCTQLRKYREGKRGDRHRHTASQESRWPTPHRASPENPQIRPIEEPMQLEKA